MDEFEQAWASTQIPEEGDVSPRLKPLVEPVYRLLLGHSRDLRALKKALVRLLEFLSSSEGRWHANCVKTDLDRKSVV